MQIRQRSVEDLRVVSIRVIATNRFENMLIVAASAKPSPRVLYLKGRRSSATDSAERFGDFINSAKQETETLTGVSAVFPCFMPIAYSSVRAKKRRRWSGKL